MNFKTILRHRFFIFAVVILLLLSLFVYFGNTAARALESNKPSVCYGSSSRGSLDYGKRLPTRGANFVSYSYLGTALGRNALHHRVRDVVLQTYGELAKQLPRKTFVYGETGWPGGGRLRPHRTHRNGLSVDFMAPVLNRRGVSVPLTTHVFNRWGYAVEFDSRGRHANWRIDFEAMAAHLYYLQQTAKRLGVGIRIVILAPDLQPHLFATARGKSLQKNLRFSRNPSWVRHDDHYHVEFIVPCKTKR